MKTPAITVERRRRFLSALSQSGDVRTAAEIAKTDPRVVRELRESDPDFASDWEKAEAAAANNLEALARALATEGLMQPVTSDGKVVRDDKGQPLAIRWRSEQALLALLRAQMPTRYGSWVGMSDALYPRWLRWLIGVFVITTCVTSLGGLIAQLVRSH